MGKAIRTLRRGKRLLAPTSAQERVGRSCNSHPAKSFYIGRQFVRRLYFLKMSATTFPRYSQREGQCARPLATMRNFLQVRPRRGELGKCWHQPKHSRAGGSSLCAVEATQAHSSGDYSHPP